VATAAIGGLDDPVVEALAMAVEQPGEPIAGARVVAEDERGPIQRTSGVLVLESPAGKVAVALCAERARTATCG
jgi:hypothetical protein